MDLTIIQKCGEVKEFKKDEFICMENEEGHKAFLLLEGKANVVLNSFGSHSPVVKTLKPGTLFGEMSLLEGKPRTASILAGEDGTKVVEIEKDDFLNIVKNEPNVGCELFKLLLENLSDTLEQIGNTRVTVAIKRNKIYRQLQHLTTEQFVGIVEENPEYCLNILNFLSRSLAETDRDLQEKIDKESQQ